MTTYEAMTTYRVEQTTTGVVLYEGKAISPAGILEFMAMDAGYGAYSDIPEGIGGREELCIVDEHGRRTMASDVDFPSHRSP